MSNSKASRKDDATMNAPIDGHVSETKVVRREAIGGQRRDHLSNVKTHRAEDGSTKSRSADERPPSYGRQYATSGNECMNWLQQKKLRQMETVRRSSYASRGSSTMKEDVSTCSAASGEHSNGRTRRRGSLFDKLLEQGIDEEEAARRQKMYNNLKQVVGDLDC